MSHLSRRSAAPAVGASVPHESARLHVSGQALYTDDLAQRTAGALTAWPVQSPHAHALVRSMDTTAALAIPGVIRVLTAQDVPGINDCGIKHDEPLFPSEAMYYGHALAWVLGEDQNAARAGAAAVVVDYLPLPSLISVAEAIQAQSFQGMKRTISRGDADAALATADRVMSGVTEFSGQEHFYLETQAALATVDEGGQIFVQSSTQHPSEAQATIAHVLGRASNEITVQSLRMGGGFGGKEMQSHGFAAIASIGTLLTGRPVRVRLNRTLDMTMTGKRHGFHTSWEAGFSSEGKLLALKALLTADGGWCLDLSEAVLARALCHVDNNYFIPHVHLDGRVAKTNKTSQTAFRGFGGPQGMLMIEDILGRSAPLLGLAPEELRRRNFYRDGDSTPYGMPVRHAERVTTMWQEALERSNFAERRREVNAFNAAHPGRRRGLAITPVKFGISFNLVALNQAGALVHVYKDGSVLISHGGTEMGQGLHTKMLQIAATSLGIPLSGVRLAPTRTDKVPNTSATAASSGTDLNGGAVKNACEQILGRIAVVAGAMLGVPAQDVRFSGGLVTGLGVTDQSFTFAEVVMQAYLQRVQLWAAGYYRTGGLHWNPELMQGEPFKYFAGGVSVTEMEVDGFTGTYSTRRVDIVHDAGDSLSPIIDVGQIEGGYVQGVGWLTLEDLRWDESNGPHRGRLLTQSASTYKLPSFSEMPELFNVHLMEHAEEEGAVYGSKAVGEPPLMLAFSAREALRDAISSFGPAHHSVELASPATPEAVFWAIQESCKAAGTSFEENALSAARLRPVTVRP
ncbi:xanthine dehydrogenase molybdopterin binding subunit [Arthrobacter glacialis]|uniref:xanthine dehydrogenase molybdopterin binding subunit n=1 Tax=Arthrobacter glacialis TaxID=1664 RepID=UPI000CD4604C|nr:xanthine dehydrogenase molybdopterin binding subunit [Arthrobacter glacialis]POH58981.1 xanthine dehydrogenase molybdopterin binding subunit [Arthrobacter glacialis]